MGFLSSRNHALSCQVMLPNDPVHGIAHNKIMIIDQETVITGSFNFTRAAEENSADNLLIIRNKDLAREYLENWGKHRAQSEGYMGK
jgi:phosphatidylserine/phosphatidylglycerophosphate/cardiolipin synthase-like enzyme